MIYKLLRVSRYMDGYVFLMCECRDVDFQGFAIGPLCLAPISEEFGRYWAYVGAVLAYGLCHLFLGL